MSSVMCVSSCFFFDCNADNRERHVLTHSFPTRRSADLMTSSPHLVFSCGNDTKSCGLFTKSSIHSCGQGGVMVEPIGAPARDSAPVDNFGGRGAIAPESPLLASIHMLPPEMRHVAQNERGLRIRMDRASDAIPTVFGNATLTDRYLMPGESFTDLFARVAMTFAAD